MTTTTETAPAVISPQDRTEILQFATYLLPVRARGDAETVVRLAGPLLEWAQQADGKDDQRARMAAMRRQHNNEPAAPKLLVPPEEFLARARIHYAFITGGE